MFTAEQIEHLSGPLDRTKVKSRNQAGQTLSYIEGWHAIAEANRIFGFDAWNRETLETLKCGEPELGKDRNGNDQWRVRFMCRVRITVGKVVRDGTGYGSGIGKDMGDCYESAIKEAETDAMKRALMTFGNPFGLALYDKTQANVATPPAPPERKSSAQAKRDGDDTTIKGRLLGANSVEELDAIWADVQANTMPTLPIAWEQGMQDFYETQRDVLKERAS
jgi:DNA repair and recombination protein RAD52